MTEPPGSRAPPLRSLAVGLVVLLATIALLDAASWLALPARIARRFPGYHVPFHDVLTGGQGKYPQDYFIKHPERGFDIGPHRRGTHYVEGLTYPIWSNGWGCFDKDWDPPPTHYYYFAGDSMTWGYSPYETKFATVFERLTGIDSVKCGVTHTGTLHQLSKFREVTAKIGTLPQKVFVGYFFNDTADDYAYPFATVERGWLIDDAYLDGDLEVVRVPEEWVRRKVDFYLASRARESRPPKMLFEYSFTTQVLSTVYGAVANAFHTPRPGEIFERGPGPDGRMLYDLTWLSTVQKARGHLEYASFARAERNKDAIKAWKADADAHGYELVFLLFESPEFYVELHRFLDDNHVAYIDLRTEFAKRNFGYYDLYWPNDGHLAPKGNEVTGQILSELETRSARP